MKYGISVTNKKRQVTRTQLKLLGLPGNEPAESLLPQERLEKERQQTQENTGLGTLHTARTTVCVRLPLESARR